ncbi:MAG: FAD-dependent oxidoreductase [Clostridia bacterium]|nr:FAD-dependent oxidoreductase [Clostridia bacterium]
MQSGKIAELAGDNSITIGGRKGEYILLDRESGDFVSHTLFFTPTKKGKGILVTQTVDNNILLGPTAEELEYSDTTTSANGLNFVISKAKTMCKNPPLFNTITSFAGMRAYSSRHDFIIEESQSVKGLIHCAGIESPGLTSAPAIAEYVVNELVGKIVALEKNERFNGTRKPDYFFKNLSVDEKNELIKKEPSYGKIVCRCEQITEGEILRVIRENPPAKDIDGVKRRTRSGMGRCQGGFCQPYVAELLAREQNIPLESVTKKGKDSYLLTGVTK